MRSGTRSKLTLVDRNGLEIPHQNGEDDMAVEYQATPPNDGASQVGDILRGVKQTRRSQLIAFAAVSAGCTIAAIATGSYALWLSRRKIADEALINVHDILRTCQDRVTRMEAELSHLPSRSSTPSSS